MEACQGFSFQTLPSLIPTPNQTELCEECSILYSLLPPGGSYLSQRERPRALPTSCSATPIFNKDLEVNLQSLNLSIFYGRTQRAVCIPQPHPNITRTTSHQFCMRRSEGTAGLQRSISLCVYIIHFNPVLNLMHL